MPSGVAAFQEAITSVAGTAGRWTGEVQLAYSQVAVVPVCGSVWSVLPAGAEITRPGRRPGTARVPAEEPQRQSE